MKINTDALNNVYELMGRLDPDQWDVNSDGSWITVKLRRIGSSEYYVVFKGGCMIEVCRTNVMGKIVGKDVISTTRVTPEMLYDTMKEIWGDVHIPEFDRKMLK